MKLIGALTVIVAAGIAMAQQSTSFQLQEHVFNAGGHPTNGTVLVSPSYQIRLDAIGDAVTGETPASSSYLVDGNFVGGYTTPGEVSGLRFLSKTDLDWIPERSVGVYNVYRDLTSALPVNYGTCFQNGVATDSAVDTGLPATGSCFFYLVTAENRLGEEGTKGYRSSGAERPNPVPCP